MAFADWSTVTPSGRTHGAGVWSQLQGSFIFFLENKQKILNLLRVELATVIRSL